MVKTTQQPISSQSVATKRQRTKGNGCVGPEVGDPSSVQDTSS